MSKEELLVLIKDELDLETSDLDDYEQYRKVVRASLAQWLINLNAGTIKLTSVSDLKMLIEVDEMLKNLKNDVRT